MAERDDIASTKSMKDGAPALVRQVRLEVIAGCDQGKTFDSKGDRLVIGTRRAADFTLHDAAVSRFHCELVIDGGRVHVRDLDSRNGTRVDGVLVESATLTGDAVLTVGATRVRVGLGDASIEVPLSARDRFGTLAGRSRAMRAAFALCERAAETAVTVLLQGETGTGKDLAAESIHQESARKDGPFVVVDCGAIPEGLIESELFGHEKGAFTGARTAHEGAFESASGGTLFLDEVGELPLDMQPKLLRALDARQIRRLGGTAPVDVDVRFIAATNRDLQRDVNARRFRSDLYYRLAVLVIRMPPLRDRLEDLPLMVETILAQMGVLPEAPAAERARSAESIARLSRHRWPGNGRELRNYLERSLAMEEASPTNAEPESAEPVVDAHLPIRIARQRWIDAFERRYLEALLRAHQGNVAKAAKAAGVARVHLYRLLDRAGVRRQKR